MGAHGWLAFGVTCPLSCGPRVEGVRAFLLTQPDLSPLGASGSGWWVLLTQLSSWWGTGAGHHWGPAFSSSGTDGPAGGVGRLNEALGHGWGGGPLCGPLGWLETPPFLLEGDMLVGTRRSPQVPAESGPGLLTRKEARSHSPC